MIRVVTGHVVAERPAVVGRQRVARVHVLAQADCRRRGQRIVYEHGVGGGQRACSNNTPVSAGPVSVIVNIPPSITIAKSERVNGGGAFVLGPLTANVGDTVNYQITVVAGQTPLTAVSLSDPRCDSGTLSPSGLQSFVANQSRDFTCSHKLTAADAGNGSFTNTASVTGNGPAPNNTPVSAGPVSVIVNIPPSITIAKSERVNGGGAFVTGPLTANVGDTVNYQITVVAGQTPLTAVSLSDPQCDSGTLSPSGAQSFVANQSRVFTCSHPGC